MSAQHTPLRVTGDAGGWQASYDVSHGTSACCAIRAGDEVLALVVARSPEPWSDPDPRPMSQRIVQCVNAHDELVAALSKTERFLNISSFIDDKDAHALLTEVIAALAKAGVQP